MTSPYRLSAGYLNDHLAAATAAARRACRTAEALLDADARPPLRRLAAELEGDLASLRRVMRELDVPERQSAVWLARGGELLGLLKPNGSLWHRTPLTDLVELEALRLAVLGKRQLWTALSGHHGLGCRLDRQRLTELVARADHQAETLEELRLRAARTVGRVAVGPGLPGGWATRPARRR
ncbi:hypothetical protein [Kitasatospora sp. NPDC002040]|uniref:hypothetical protein n=1 Tax=Kitasatospora sp. NPDC002040 TaxID=3154661 RepID=UPI00332279EB